MRGGADCAENDEGTGGGIIRTRLKGAEGSVSAEESVFDEGVGAVGAERAEGVGATSSQESDCCGLGFMTLFRHLFRVDRFDPTDPRDTPPI